MRKLIVGFGALIVPALVAGLTMTGCGEDSDNPLTGASEDICGPCGVVARGDVGISGDARLDGLFAAVGDLGKVTAQINGNFESNLSDLETAFGVTAQGDISTRVDNLIAAIETSISANVDGGIEVAYQPPQCSANVELAVEAQANCEAKAGCEVQATPGEVSVTCEGECTGTCEGSCAADATAMCEVSGPDVQCTGSCEGTCQVQLEAAAQCDGVCNGTCNGECSAQNADGSCSGQCSGTCEGTCSLKGEAAANCNGTCNGSCKVERPEAGCSAEANLECEGKCEGSCSGGCTGTATPPEFDADCEAKADCQASASAQGSANLDCTPPNLTVQYFFKADLSAAQQADFMAKLDALKVHGAAMIQGFVRYKALFTGELEGGVQITPPVATIEARVDALVSAVAAGNLEFEVPPGRIGCLAAAFGEAAGMIADMSAEASANIEAQAKFATAFTTGFSGS